MSQSNHQRAIPHDTLPTESLRTADGGVPSIHASQNVLQENFKSLALSLPSGERSLLALLLVEGGTIEGLPLSNSSVTRLQPLIAMSLGFDPLFVVEFGLELFTYESMLSQVNTSPLNDEDV